MHQGWSEMKSLNDCTTVLHVHTNKPTLNRTTKLENSNSFYRIELHDLKGLEKDAQITVIINITSQYRTFMDFMILWIFHGFNRSELFADESRGKLRKHTRIANWISIVRSDAW